MIGTNARIPKSGQKHETKCICVSSEHCHSKKSDNLRTPDVRTRTSSGGEGESSIDDVKRLFSRVVGVMCLKKSRVTFKRRVCLKEKIAYEGKASDLRVELTALLIAVVISSLEAYGMHKLRMALSDNMSD